MKDKLDGIGWFSFQVLRRITQQHKDVHFVFLFDRPYDESFIFSDNITPIIMSPQARHPFLYYTWFQLSVKPLLNKMKPDLFLSPDGFLSLGAKCRQLPVIHDLNFLHNPQDVRFLTSKYYNYFFPKFAKAATRIATVSEYSRQDIANSYGIDHSRIDVVYNGINEGFRPLNDAEQAQVRLRHTQGKPYFLFVGSQSPRKNLVRLIKAFTQFKTVTGADMKLVLAGTNFWGEGEVHKAIEQSPAKSDIIFTGRLAQPELEQLMGAAFALTFVPYFEGFGIPIVEAFACDTPVLSANTTCMPEVAGPAALYADPFSVADMTEKMILLYKDGALRSALVEKGRIQKQQFSWDRSAALLWQSIERAVAT